MSCSQPTRRGGAASTRPRCAPAGSTRSSRCSPRRRWTGRPTAGRPTGGRAGVHTEHLCYLLAEMQVLHRAHPGAHGEHSCDAGGRRPVRRPGAARGRPSRSWASCATCRGRRRRPGHRRRSPRPTPAARRWTRSGADIRRALAERRAPRGRVRTVLRAGLVAPTGSPRPGRAKLAAAGIAPPAAGAPRPVAVAAAPCAARAAARRTTEELHRFGVDRVQVAVALPGLPRAVRRGEGAVMSRCTRPPPPAFHPLTVAAVEPARPTTRWRSPSPCRPTLRDAFAFRAGQHLTVRPT